MGRQLNQYGGHGRISTQYRLDRRKPLAQQHGESDRIYGYFLRYLDNPKRQLKDLADELGMRADSLSVHKRKYQWELRAALGGKNTAKKEPPKDQPKAAKRGPGRPRKHPKIEETKEAKVELLPPPEPIERGLHAFAQKYADVIAPGFEIDAVVDTILTALEEWIDGPSGGRLMLNPPPRHSKTTCAILALCYSLLRYPDRGHIIISANNRLSAMTSQKFKTLFLAACPEGYGLSADSKSKIAWAPTWQGAQTQLAASRGGALLGYTGHMVYVDDVIPQIKELESPEILDQTMTTIGVDVMSRLTKDGAGKAAGLCICQQRLGVNDVTGTLIERDKTAEAEAIQTTPWDVVASPAINPTLEEKARIIDSYPSTWSIKFPVFGEPGEPVSHRFDKRFFQELEVQMPPNAYQAMYLLNTAVEVGFCAWREHYLQEVEPEDVQCTSTFAALDMALIGGAGRDSSAMVIGGVHGDGVIIVGIHELAGEVDQQLGQIVELAKQYNCHTIGVEQAASGAWVLKSLNNRIGDKTFNTVSLSHQGKNKGARLNDILGPASNGKFYIQKGLALAPKLHQQLRLIATTGGKTKRHDDIGDSAAYCLSWIWNHWCKSGFNPSAVSWGGGSGGAPGVTECIWGRGSHALVRPQVGIDGVERYQLPGFG